MPQRKDSRFKLPDNASFITIFFILHFFLFIWQRIFELLFLNIFNFYSNVTDMHYADLLFCFTDSKEKYLVEILEL